MFRSQAALQRWNFNKCSQRHNTTQHQCSRKWNNIDCRSRRACSDNIYLDLVLLSSQHICTKLMRPCFVSMLRKFLRCSVFVQIIKAWANIASDSSKPSSFKIFFTLSISSSCLLVRAFCSLWSLMMSVRSLRQTAIKALSQWCSLTMMSTRREQRPPVVRCVSPNSDQ